MKRITLTFILIAFTAFLTAFTAYAGEKLTVYDEATLGVHNWTFGLSDGDTIVVAASKDGPSGGRFDMAWLQPGTVFTVYFDYGGDYGDSLLSGIGLGFINRRGNSWGNGNNVSQVVDSESGAIVDLENGTIQVTYEMLIAHTSYDQKLGTFADNAAYIDVSLTSRWSEPNRVPVMIKAVTIGNVEKGASAPWLNTYRGFTGDFPTPTPTPTERPRRQSSVKPDNVPLYFNILAAASVTSTVILAGTAVVIIKKRKY